MIKYRLANYSDNQQLIALTAASGMPGETALRIDRKPDFFKLLQMRGETKVFVASEDDTIIGCICVSLQQVYIGGQVFPIHYIGDFKVAASYRNKGIGMQLCNEMANYVIATGTDLVFLNVSKGNTKPVSFFKNRPNVPDFKNIGIFNIYQFIGKRMPASYGNYKIELSPVTDEIITYLNEQYGKYELGSVITKEQLEGTAVYTIRHNENLVAAMCLIDTMPIKQNVVTNISWKMKWLLKLMNGTRKISGISKMPTLNEPVQMMYIKYFAVNGREKELVQLLVNHACNIVYEKSYSFVSIGLHEKDPLNACFSGIRKLTFYSVGMLLSIKNNTALIEKVSQGIPFEDYSLV